MRQPELKNLVRNAMIKNQHYADSFKGNDNPKVKEMRDCALGKVDAYMTVLEAMDNDPVLIKIEGAS